VVTTGAGTRPQRQQDEQREKRLPSPLDEFRSRSGRKMPEAGRVVCHSCGAAGEFRSLNEKPFWRCRLPLG